MMKNKKQEKGYKSIDKNKIDENKKIGKKQNKNSDKYMSREELAHFEKILKELEQKLIHDAEKMAKEIQETSMQFPDPIDRASEEGFRRMELCNRDRERKLLRKVIDALRRIQDGSYGYCVECGAQIGIERLTARPTATKCIECKSVEEIREKQAGGGAFAGHDEVRDDESE